MSGLCGRNGMTNRIQFARILLAGIAATLAIALPKMQAGKRAAAVPVGGSDIGGVVASSKGPEAGVWVIAETSDLPTKYAKIVVTDDQGRYLVPDLPRANYKVWVRGYGLVDSSPVETAPGKDVNLIARLAPDARTAAQYYPGAYWYSLLKLPAKNEFPGTGPSGNGISPAMKSQGQWVEWVKTDGCQGCHQLGDKATRELPASLGHFDSSVLAWSRRISSAQVGGNMNSSLERFGRERAL